MNDRANNHANTRVRRGGGSSRGRNPSAKTTPQPGEVTRAAGRLLAALAEEGAYALPDPTDEGTLVLRRHRAGVSLGGGRFPAGLADTLLRHDLVTWQATGGRGQRRLVMSAPGAAWIARAGSGEAGFREQHGAMSEVVIAMEGGRERVRIDLDESPLDWLRRRRDRDGAPLIDAASHQAGERLRADITQAGLLPGVTSRWDGVRVDGGARGPADASDRMVAARQRVRHAFEAVGADFSDLLMDLCGFLKGLETIERERRWPPRSAKVVVRLALGRLAEHYGLEAEARGPATARRIRAWQAVVIEGGLGAP